MVSRWRPFVRVVLETVLTGRALEIAGGLIAGDVIAGGLIAGDVIAGGLIAGDVIAGGLIAGDVTAGDVTDEL